MRKLPILFFAFFTALLACGCTPKVAAPSTTSTSPSAPPVSSVAPAAEVVDQETLVARSIELGATIERNPLGIPYAADMTKAKPDAWPALAQIPTIASVRVGELSEDSLAILVGMKQLATLSCTSQTAIDDTRLAEIARLQELTTLELPGAQVTSEGLKNLANIRRLHTLSLTHSTMNDETLPLLGALMYLRQLNLTGTQCTEVGIEALQPMLPMCLITR